MAKHTYCNACLAKWQTARTAAKVAQGEGAGFGKGAEAMRETLAREFERFGFLQFTARDVAGAIRKAPRPQYQPVPAGNA